MPAVEVATLWLCAALRRDLGLSPCRTSNPLAEALAAYSARGYDGVLDEYERVRVAAQRPRAPRALST